MTADLIHPLVKEELAGLSMKAKTELKSFLRNKAAIISGQAQLIAGDDRAHPVLRSKARLMVQVAELMCEEFDELLRGEQ